MIWSREESIIAHHKRHPMRIKTRWGATLEGKITAIETEIVADGGAYASTSVKVTKVASIFANGCYDVENIATDGYAVYTNNVPCGAFRGFGAPQAQFAAETMVNRLAEALDLDVVDIRRKNLYREGSLEATQHPLPEGVSIREVLDACVAESERRWGKTSFEERHPAPHLRRGFGLACGIKNVGYSFGFPEQSTAKVELYGRGDLERAVVRVGAADVGQGAHTALRQIAAERLGLAVELVQMVTDDSSEAPNAGSASASRMTLMAGRAVNDAAIEALEKWRNSDDLQVDATVQYRPPATTPLDLETGAGIPNYCYGYSAQAVEVEVNLLTGQVQVLTIISAHDVGKAINRQQVEAQIEGCLAQALGYALLENFQVKDGHVLTPYFSTYLLPTSLDMPVEIVPVILELADPNGPYGARGVAEMPLVPFAPAVAAAIHDATGVWLFEQPMTPERVLNGLMANQAVQQGDD
jgi:CO/xanthine dehydrogenase Mo-binding subunit